LEQTESISTSKTQNFRKFSFETLTQLSQGKKVIDGPAAKIDGFLSRDLCVSSTQVNRPAWNIESLLQL
jgi:hypothetical protein